MVFGVHARVTAATDVAALARRIEELGFESFFLPEHTHVAASFVAGNPEQAAWAETTEGLFDPFVALGVAAAATSGMKLGTGICLVPQHHPITLAKQTATLDVVSNGRFLFGVGAGWIEAELRHHGVDPRRRFMLLRESVLAITQLWTGDEVTFDGELVRFSGVRVGPRPVQLPHPPILVGGSGPRVLERVLEYGDEWFPHAEPGLEARIAELDGRAPVTVFDATPRDDAIERYAAAGVSRCVFTVDPEDAKALEHLASLADRAG
jgi:probable F420-dependent oxidoreductase